MPTTKIWRAITGDLKPEEMKRTPMVPSIALLESVAQALAHSMRYSFERPIASCIAQDFARDISNYLSDDEVAAFWNMLEKAKQWEGRRS